MADEAIGSLKSLSGDAPKYTAPLFNMASIQYERGRQGAAADTLKSFLALEKGGKYAAYARKRLGMKAEGGGAQIKVAPESPVKLGKPDEKTRRMLSGMKKTSFKSGKYDCTIYEDGVVKILMIDGFIELVEHPFRAAAAKLKSDFGEPLNIITTTTGETMVYENFAVDVQNGDLNTIVHFKSDI
jgi:hypothetical protein